MESLFSGNFGVDCKHIPLPLPKKTFMLILWLGSCSNAHAMRPRGAGVWEKQAQLLEGSHPEGELGTSPGSILRGGVVRWSTWQSAPTWASSPARHPVVAAAETQGWCWWCKVLQAPMGATRGSHRWQAQPLFCPEALQMGTERRGWVAEVHYCHLPQGCFPILRRKGSSWFLVSSWRILARLSFALTLLFNLQ